MAETTGKTTVRGRPVYLDPTSGEEYSEKTVTVPYGDGFVVIPSIVDNGIQLSEDDVYEYVTKNGPYDILTGEKLPVHSNMDAADRYANWRSDNQFNESILDETYWHRDAAMPYYADPSQSYNTDGPALNAYRPTLRENARNNLREKLEGFGLSEGVSRSVATGLAGEENPTDGGLGMGLMDFTPLGIAMGGQEARRDFNRASNADDYVGMGVAGVDGALTLAEAVPGIGLAAKGVRRTVDAALDAYTPNTVGAFGGNLFARGFTEPSAETLDVMRTTYPDMDAREEVYRIGERPHPLANGTEIKVGPEKELVEVPMYPELDAERSSVFIDPDRAIVEYDGEFSNTITPTQGAKYLEEIVEQNDDVLYRGMSAEEYRGALDQGYIKSQGRYNIGDEQEGLTFFSTNPAQAQSYASNYTPDGFAATPDRPAYVVAVRRPKTIDYVTGETEMGLRGEIPTSDIVEVYEGRPYMFRSNVESWGDWGGTSISGKPDISSVTWERLETSPTDLRPENPNTFAMGGLSLRDATKGITTQEGEKMAKKKFQLDPSKTDPNGDGERTEMEKVQAEAEQKAAVEAGDIELDEADEAIGMNCGGMMAPEEMMDPVSGNAVPLGSSPENVRDDIPAMLSQDEYVLPAHVVKWHGLKHIQDMQSEAEMGLMGMDMMGLIGGQELDEEEPEETETTSSDDIPTEDIDVETPMVEVKDDLDDSEYEEVTEESALPGMMKKQKYAFIMS